MTTRIIAVVTIAALLNAALGCSSTVLVRPGVLKKTPEQIYILEAHLRSGEIIVFESPGGVLVAEEQIVRGPIRDRLSQIKTVEIKEDDIQYVKINRKSEEKKRAGFLKGGLVFGGLMIVAVAIAIAFATRIEGPLM